MSGSSRFGGMVSAARARHNSLQHEVPCKDCNSEIFPFFLQFWGVLYTFSKFGLSNSLVKQRYTLLLVLYQGISTQTQWQRIVMGSTCAPAASNTVMAVVAVILFGVMALHGAAQTINVCLKETEILDNILGDAYDSRVRPAGANGTGPTEVRVNLFLRSIDNIDDYKMEYSIQITVRQEWLDERLRFDTQQAYQELEYGKLRYVSLKDSSRIWMPDLFFANERHGNLHNFLQPNFYIRIHPDGRVLYSIRVSLTLWCPMILKNYPLDKQSCNLRMASYGCTTEDLTLKWWHHDPIQVTSDLHLPRFALEQLATSYCYSQTNSGTYSCLRLDILFKREFSYYLVQIYIPCWILVVASWLSFWMDPSATPERISLGVTILLAMVTQISGINSNLPPVSYTKALDWWTSFCLAFIFGALIEIALVSYTSRSDEQLKKVTTDHNQVEPEPVAVLDATTGVTANRSDGGSGIINRMRSMILHPTEALKFNDEQHGETNKEGNSKRELYVISWWSGLSRPKRIDLVSRVVFPLLFAIFNMCYWSAYL